MHSVLRRWLLTCYNNMSGVNLWECRRWRVGSHTLIFNDNVVGVRFVVKEKDEGISTKVAG